MRPASYSAPASRNSRSSTRTINSQDPYQTPTSSGPRSSMSRLIRSSSSSETLKKLYGVEPTVRRELGPDQRPPAHSLRSTRTNWKDGCTPDQEGLAEPLIVVRRLTLDPGRRTSPGDSGRRAGIKNLDAYIVEVRENIELGMERTARTLNLHTLDDIKVLDCARHPLVADAPACASAVVDHFILFCGGLVRDLGHSRGKRAGSIHGAEREAVSMNATYSPGSPHKAQATCGAPSSRSCGYR